MMTTLKKVLALLTAALLMLSFASCDKSASIKKAFEKENYTVVSYKGTDDAAKSFIEMLALSEEEEKKAAEYEIIFCNEKEEAATNQSALGGILDGIGDALDGAIPDAVIIKFPAASDLKAALTVEKEDGTADTSLYDEAEKDGKINGNCLLLVGGEDELAIFG